MSDLETIVRTEALSKTFGETLALDGLDLEVPAGQVLGFLGPNGAGKTTTLRLLTGSCGSGPTPERRSSSPPTCCPRSSTSPNRWRSSAPAA